MTEDPHRKRGRPKGPPKKKPPPSKMGRPSVWIHPTKAQSIWAIPEFFEAFKSQEFKAKVQELTLDFLARNCDNKRVESKPGEAD